MQNKKYVNENHVIKLISVWKRFQKAIQVKVKQQHLLVEGELQLKTAWQKIKQQIWWSKILRIVIQYPSNIKVKGLWS